MTVYVEYVFLNNLAINYLIAYLTLTALREDVKIGRTLLVATIGGLFSVLQLYFDGYNAVVKILLSIVMVALLKKEYTLNSFTLALTVFYLISFAFAGAALMLENFYDLNGSLYYFAVCGGILLAFAVVRYSVKSLYERKMTKEYHLPVEVMTEEGAVQLTGYYDSGNKLTDQNGSPVVVIGRTLSEKLKLSQDGEIAVNTVGGVKILSLVAIKLKIYYSSGANKLYRTHAAVSDSLAARGYDIILHRDMGGNNE